MPGFQKGFWAKSSSFVFASFLNVSLGLSSVPLAVSGFVPCPLLDRAPPNWWKEETGREIPQPVDGDLAPPRLYLVVPCPQLFHLCSCLPWPHWSLIQKPTVCYLSLWTLNLPQPPSWPPTSQILSGISSVEFEPWYQLQRPTLLCLDLHTRLVSVTRRSGLQ